MIHAEAQRRFLETLSPYARQYLPQLPRADVDRVTGVEPSISLEQRITRGGATSTVATVTEVAHYLRLLYARVGVPTGAALHLTAKSSARELVRILGQRFGAQTELSVLAPVVQGRKGMYRELFDKALDAGISEARIDGKWRKLSAGLALDRYKEHNVDLLIGRVTRRCAARQRCRHAARRAEGSVRVIVQGRGADLCARRGRQQGGVLDPRIFSFNTRQGACASCEGKGYLVVTKGRGKKAHEEREPCEACARHAPVGAGALDPGAGPAHHPLSEHERQRGARRAAGNSSSRAAMR